MSETEAGDRGLSSGDLFLCSSAAGALAAVFILALAAQDWIYASLTVAALVGGSLLLFFSALGLVRLHERVRAGRRHRAKTV